MAQTTNLNADVAVVGGGLAGVCAAIAAARHGAQVILIQDRPVLGGNTSSEIQVHATGADCSGGRPHAREGGILEEMRLAEAVRNPQRCGQVWDLVLWEWVTREPNLTLLLNTICTGATSADGIITSLTAQRQSTEDLFEITARVFIDCSGDGRLAAEAGAGFMTGREGKDAFGEPDAEGPDNKTMGCSLMFIAKDMGVPVPFVAPPWAVKFTEDMLPHRGHGELSHGHWWIEYGGELDVIKDYEAIRDHLLACLMGLWDHVKNGGRHGAENWALTWFAFVPGKRESRRIIGEHILTEVDLLELRQFPDAVAHGGWSIDTHPPGGIHSPEPPSKHLNTPDVYGIPLRCLISCDRPNLMMAGRCHSATHMAMASTRVAATGAAMGQAAGTAAALAVQHDCLPKVVAEAHAAELQQTLLRDDQFIPNVANADPLDLARQATVTASSAAPDAAPAKVTDGVTRLRDGDLHQWVSAEGAALPQWLQLEWAGPITLRELHLTFDSGFARPLTLTQSDGFNSRVVRGPQPEVVSDYVIEAQQNGEWREIARVTDNIQRKVVHCVEPLEVQAIRLVANRTHGAPQARVYEVRAYE
ncbi:MAG: FAD-dependent oxidoreductase [Armatimonadetes bacterium]|nr:FAD-dependent oxidoreductase [Armatimonadota bacterium]